MTCELIATAARVRNAYRGWTTTVPGAWGCPCNLVSFPGLGEVPSTGARELCSLLLSTSAFVLLAG